VDLVIDRGGDLLAVEIKYARKFDLKFTKGLLAFQSVAKKPVVPILVYRGEETQKRKDVLVLPYQLFLEGLDEGGFESNQP
jgi:hypothetical protein